ncbi:MULTISPECIES: peptide deformylase [unclassified Shewanella]|uniref:peptide deformylase n=1 Tax=unclassified Shewanella TaxID=196818 RepID=UPI000C815707|nr:MULTISPECIES: peptide deformylase [unclassified Shewanella]MDO6617950.1 peptide deformylase [Shewanella sp. 6_MG-2023]MDO6639924.1 peptide deformylase [Shewanella sp. 5_MG-2023]PMG28123.1 peptide deformylase [Shewanella sp. 10N.286.52.C2]PMG40384.1 peptide deformylase [Shewanella sp. 10N.286.52.B9]PMH86937.1 peptide deformylase [Shewanella sp. 10N.286.48.B5]
MLESNILTIAKTGAAILTHQTQPVVTFDQALVQLTDDMMATMLAANGVGIAAPQVFSNKAVFIMHSRPNARYPSIPTSQATIVINPQIISSSLEVEAATEGCLSIDNQRVSVYRHKHINVEYQTLSGKWVTQQLSGFDARIFQHEFDHLQGITLLERINMPDQQQAFDQEKSRLQDVC